MGVVVFFAESRSCEVDFWFMLGEVSEQMVVNELTAVVAVEAILFKGLVGLNVFDLFDNAGGAEHFKSRI